MRTRVAYELIADSVFRITVLYRLLLHLETLQYGNILAISLAIHTTSSKPEKIFLLILSVVRTLLKFYIFIYLKFFGQNECLLAFLL